jgi:hypothetical protein
MRAAGSFGRKRGEADIEMVDQGDYHDAPDPQRSFNGLKSRIAASH